MGFHTYDVDRADRLEDPARYEWASAEELRSLLALQAEDTVVDLGSGTGFYTDDIAPHVAKVYAVDLQPGMHARYAEKGLPTNARPVTARIASLPFTGASLDAAFTTMTYHEFASDEAMAEIARVLRPGGRFVTIDWSRHGTRPDGPPLDQRYDLGHIVDALEAAGFSVDRASSRGETFVCRAIR